MKPYLAITMLLALLGAAPRHQVGVVPLPSCPRKNFFQIGKNVIWLPSSVVLDQSQNSRVFPTLGNGLAREYAFELKRNYGIHPGSSIAIAGQHLVDQFGVGTAPEVPTIFHVIQTAHDGNDTDVLAKTSVLTITKADFLGINAANRPITVRRDENGDTVVTGGGLYPVTVCR